jgi:hypothetical protein
MFGHSASRRWRSCRDGANSLRAQLVGMLGSGGAARPHPEFYPRPAAPLPGVFTVLLTLFEPNRPRTREIRHLAAIQTRPSHACPALSYTALTMIPRRP